MSFLSPSRNGGDAWAQVSESGASNRKPHLRCIPLAFRDLEGVDFLLVVGFSGKQRLLNW